MGVYNESGIGRSARIRGCSSSPHLPFCSVFPCISLCFWGLFSLLYLLQSSMLSLTDFTDVYPLVASHHRCIGSSVPLRSAASDSENPHFSRNLQGNRSARTCISISSSWTDEPPGTQTKLDAQIPFPVSFPTSDAVISVVSIGLGTVQFRFHFESRSFQISVLRSQ